MSRSLSWINANELDSLFAQMGLNDEAESESNAPNRPARIQFDRLAQQEANNPFDRQAKQQQLANAAGNTPLSAIGAARAAAPAIPPLLPIAETSLAMDMALASWRANNELPIPQEHLGYPMCLHAFLAWLITSSDAQAGFLADQEGLPLSLHEVNEREVSVSASFTLLQQLAQMGALGEEVDELQQVTIPVSKDKMWHIARVTHPQYGTVSWGLLTSSFLTHNITQDIGAVLMAILNHAAAQNASDRS